MLRLLSFVLVLALPLAAHAPSGHAMGAATVQKAGAGRNAPSCAEVMDILARAGEQIDFPCS